MCKSIRLKRLGGAGRLVVSAAILSALILAGCGGGDKGGPTSPGAKEYALTVDIAPVGGGNEVLRDPDKKNYKDGDSVSLRAVPGFKHKFIYWSGAVLDSVNPVKFAVKGNWTVTAHFKPYYILIAPRSRNGGTVSYIDKAEYFEGDTVTLTANANSGYEFIGWTGASGASISEENPLTVIIKGDTTLTANFQKTGCDADPTAPGCPQFCTANPTAPGCVAPVEPCVANPAAPGCPGYCEANPTATGCVDLPHPCIANPTTAGCPGYCAANPTALGCVDRPDPCVANPSTPGCPQYCTLNPTVPGCAGQPDQCEVTPTAPGCPGYCAANPTAPGCFDQPDPCEANPSASGCPEYCTANPTAPECAEKPDLCDVTPTAPGCPEYCTANPTALGCDPCDVNLTPNCPNYCAVNPTAPECVGPPDPCDVNPTPNCLNYCDANPTAPGCPQYCTDNPNTPECGDCPATLPGCASYCALYPEDTENCGSYCPPTQEGCPGYDPCAANPNAAGCQTGDKKWCYWAPNSYNKCEGGCAEIGGAYCTEPSCRTEAGCTGSSGIVVTEANCGSRPVTGCGEDPCLTNPGAAGCPTGTYCYWAPTSGNPEASCEPIGGPYCEGSTCSEADCEADYGTVITDCGNPPAAAYCDYGFGNCISSTEANCNEYGVFKTSCSAAGGIYCDYGQPNSAGTGGGCYFMADVAACPRYSESVTMEACIASNTRNPNIPNPCSPGGGEYTCQ